MIRKILGQDIFLRVTVTRMGGAKEDFSDITDMTVTVWNMGSGESIMKEPAVKGNQVRLQITPDEQSAYGVYGVTLAYAKPDAESETGTRKYIVDCPFAFELVAGLSDGCCCNTQSSEEVELVGNVQVAADGINGITPHIGYNGNWFTGDSDTGVRAAGTDGKTPYIGENGNWYIGDTDTGVPAAGAKGDPGEPGQPGKDAEDGKDGKDGVDGNLMWPSCRIDSAGFLVVDIPDSQEECNLTIDEEGFLCMVMSDLV